MLHCWLSTCFILIQCNIQESLLQSNWHTLNNSITYIAVTAKKYSKRWIYILYFDIFPNHKICPSYHLYVQYLSYILHNYWLTPIHQSVSSRLIKGSGLHSHSLSLSQLSHLHSSHLALGLWEEKTSLVLDGLNYQCPSAHALLPSLPSSTLLHPPYLLPFNLFFFVFSLSNIILPESPLWGTS